MSYKAFIAEAKSKAGLDEFLREYLKEAGYNGVKVLRTPLGTSISIFVSRPGIVIGPGGRNIRELSEVLESTFGIKNPDIGVVEVENPFLEPHIVASRICDALEKGVRYRKTIRWALKRVMDSGALGVQIKVAGKLSSDRARFVKFTVGYIPSAGDPAVKNVRVATKGVLLPQGLVGVKVKILPPGVKFPDSVTLSEVQPSEETHEPEIIKATEVGEADEPKKQGA
ncbi:MAG: 30S ribosomal protein S3 [Candidatus Bathyarchaeia archaeon]